MRVVESRARFGSLALGKRVLRSCAELRTDAGVAEFLIRSSRNLDMQGQCGSRSGPLIFLSNVG